MTSSHSLLLNGLLPAAALLALAGLAFPGVVGGGCGPRNCPSPVNYCATSPNSVGTGAFISWTGTPSLVTDDFHLASSGCPPDQFLVFFYGGGQIQNPFGNGWRCVGNGGAGLFRLQPLQIDGAGTAAIKVDYTQPPAGGGPGQWLPGDTWYCQGMYRDPAGGGAQFNLTDGLEVPVCLDGEYDDMVVIPAGEFEMGDHSGTGYPSELPVHLVHLDAFYLDVCEVSNQKYADYLNAAYSQGLVTVTSKVVNQVGGAAVALCDTTASSPFTCITWNGSIFGVTVGKEEHPLLCVSWYGACTYANQRSRDHGLTPCYDETTWACNFDANGYRLPTEAEWEYAARGSEHNPYYRYSWGDWIDGSMANYFNSGDPYEGTFPVGTETTPVGYYDGNQIPAGVDMANGYGLYDMSGNAWEWCWDWYDNSYYSYSPYDNPTGPTSGSARAMRGGSWGDGTSYLRSASRSGNAPTVRNAGIGFRVLAVRP